MKKIEQIRNKYDIITEKQDTDIRKLDALARSGLFESKKLPVLKRALEKEPENMTIAERKVVLELLDSLIAETVYNQNLNEAKRESNTSGQFLTKYDPRFSNSAAVSERDMPTVIILKRKGIRVFSDNQKIGLYYSQYLDRYISIPFGPGVPSINEAVDYQKAYKDYLKDYGEEDKKTRSPEDVKRLVMQKAGEGKIRAVHYMSRPKVLGGDPEKVELKKASNKYLRDKFFRGEITALDALAAKAGVATGGALRKVISQPIRDTIRKIRGKTKAVEPTAAPAAEPSAPKTISVPKVLTKKQREVKADVSARMASARKSAIKSKDVTVPEKSRQMAATRARKIATYAQVDKKKAGLMEKIREVRDRKDQQLNEFLLGVGGRVAGRVAGPMLAKVLARAPKTQPPKGPSVEVPKGPTIPSTKPSETPAPVTPAKPPVQPATPAKPPVQPATPAKPPEPPVQPATPAKPPRPVDVPPVLPVEVPTTTPGRVVTPAVPPPVETLAIPKSLDDLPAPATMATPRTGGAPAPRGGAGGPKKPGQGRRSLGRRLGLDLDPPESPSKTPEKAPQYFDPAKFGLKITTSKPEAQVTTGVEKRQANLYRKALEAPVNEENEEENKKEQKPHLRPSSFSMSVKTSAPKARVSTGVEKRQANLYRKTLEAPVNETILKSMKKMVSENISEMQINIGESPVTINNTIAQKVVSVHESLSKDNKRQMENMLGESIESFKKIVNFAVRQ